MPQSASLREMSISGKLTYIYEMYDSLHGKFLTPPHIKKLMVAETGISWPTISKYLKIKTSLHPELLFHLDKKGKSKLSLGVASKLSESALNPEYQIEIYPEVQTMKNSEAINRGIAGCITCIICCNQSIVMEKMPCCGNFLCETCLLKTMETSINDVAFTGLKCVFCKSYFSKSYFTWFLCKIDWLGKVNPNAYQLLLKDKASDTFSEPWRHSNNYRHHTLNHQGTYSWNLWKKMESMLSSIEQSNLDIESGDYKKLFDGDMYYGPCSRCSPGVREFVKQTEDFGHIRMCSVEKTCANGEGDVVVLNDDMFVCIVCKSHEENYEDGTFKKCPHCGIKSLKPSGCNYVKCGDHRWCFICNERLENSHDGHNTHYHTGPGSSAYSSVCRQSLHMDKPKFILNTCDCLSCAPYGGAPLCRELECMERTFPLSPFLEGFSVYCEECDNPFLMMVKYYREFRREPNISEWYMSTNKNS